MAALPPESAVAPLGPLLLRLSGDGEGATPRTAPIESLGERLTGGRATLRASLEELEGAGVLVECAAQQCDGPIQIRPGIFP